MCAARDWLRLYHRNCHRLRVPMDFELSCTLPTSASVLIRHSCYEWRLLPETLDLLEGFAFGFRQAGLDKEEARHTNCGVDPERFGRTQGVVKEGESIGKNEACDPQACDCNRHCHTANTIREDF